MSFRQPGLSATWFQTCRLCCRGNASGRTCGHAHAQTFPPHACRAAAARRCWAGCGRWRARTSRAPPAARRACCGTRPRCPVRRPRARVRHAPRTALCCFHRRSVSAACARCVALQAVLNIARVRTAPGVRNACPPPAAPPRRGARPTLRRRRAQAAATASRSAAPRCACASAGPSWAARPGSWRAWTPPSTRSRPSGAARATLPCTLILPHHIPAPPPDKLYRSPLTLVHSRRLRPVALGCCEQAVFHVSQAPPACSEPAVCCPRAQVWAPACACLPARPMGARCQCWRAGGRRRVGGASTEPTLAGRDADGEPAAAADRPFVAPDRDPGAAPHFVAECFFLTQRAVHTLLMPAGARPGAACRAPAAGAAPAFSRGAAMPHSCVGLLARELWVSEISS